MELRRRSRSERRSEELSLLAGSRYVRRAVQVATVFARFGFADALHTFGFDRWLARPREGRIDAATQGLDRPVRLRLALEEIGATGVKIGQVLSTRADLLPPEYIRELRQLQEHVPPFAFEQARALVERELGAKLEELFEEFEPDPLAAASLSQVHRAVRPDGTEVAVKVQRPEVRQQIDTDLAILRLAARAAHRYSEWSRENEVVEWVEEFADILRNELDFTWEARSMERLRAQTEEDSPIVIPQVHWDLTTSRVLTMDFISGISPNEEEELQHLGLDRAALAQNFALAMFQQVAEKGFFHGDPHAGNLRVLPDGRLALLDFGHVDFAGQELREQMLNFLQSLLESDSRGMVNVLTGVGVTSARTDLSLLRLDIDKLVARYHPSPESHTTLAQAMDAVLGLLVKHRIRVPASFTSLLRTLIISEGVCLQLDPDFNGMEVAAAATRRLISLRLRPHQLASNLHSAIREMTYHARVLPRQVSELLMRVQAGGARLRIEVENVDKPLHRLDVMINRLAFAMVVAAIVLASSIVLSSAQTMPGYGSSIAISFAVLGALMGLWLLYSILRSGRL